MYYSVTCFKTVQVSCFVEASVYKSSVNNSTTKFYKCRVLSQRNTSDSQFINKTKRLNVRGEKSPYLRIKYVLLMCCLVQATFKAPQSTEKQTCRIDNENECSAD